MNDKLIKAIGFNNSARIYVVSTTNALNIVGDKLNYYPSALDSFGRVLSMGAIMGGTLKLEETVTIRIEGDGPIGKILVDADAHGHIRGYVENPHCHFEYNDKRLNSSATIGTSGTISIVKDLKLKEPFVGLSEIITGEVASDFAYYYMKSEQVPTAISLGVLVDDESRAISSGGFMVQLLPGVTDEEITEIENKINNLPPISELLSSGYTEEEIVKNIASDATILDTVNVEYKCNCSKERFRNGILSLGIDEIKAIIEEDKKAECVCHFCLNKYDFDLNELNDIYDEALKRGK